MRATPTLLLALAACGGSDITYSSQRPEIGFTPSSGIDFGAVVVGESATERLFIKNGGLVDLKATFSLDPSDPEVYRFDGLPLGEEVVIEPDGQLIVPVTFTPLAFTTYPADLIAATNIPDDAGNPQTYHYPLLGAGRAAPVPDIDLPLTSLDFGEVAPGQSATQVFFVANTGEADLHVGTVLQTGSGAFTLTTDPSGQLVAPGGAGYPVQVTYTPATSDGDSGTLQIPSDDPDEPLPIVTLSGNGGGNDTYPEARILWGEPGTAPDAPCPATVSPLAELPLSGESSTDPSGGALSYEWSVASAPTGSRGAFSDPTGVNTSLTIDVAGDWTVQLQVTSPDGTRSPPATCQITAVPSEDIRVELSWDGPTSDLDLHLADALDTPLYAAGDVSPCNPTTAWGGALSQDDDDGYGPEAVTVSGAGDGTYPVRVHYFQRNADFAVTATVRVWLGGTLMYSGSESLDYNEVWNVGVVNWPQRSFGVYSDPPEIASARQCE